MSEKEDRKEFVEPELIKCEEPLDKVTEGGGVIGGVVTYDAKPQI